MADTTEAAGDDPPVVTDAEHERLWRTLTASRAVGGSITVPVPPSRVAETALWAMWHAVNTGNRSMLTQAVDVLCAAAFPEQQMLMLLMAPKADIWDVDVTFHGHTAELGPVVEDTGRRIANTGDWPGNEDRRH